jgi:hypothetical protein
MSPSLRDLVGRPGWCDHLIEGAAFGFVCSLVLPFLALLSKMVLCPCSELASCMHTPALCEGNVLFSFW